MLMNGGGKESLYNEIIDLRNTCKIITTKASSTRQEALAILAIHSGMREVNLDGQYVIINVSDSTALRLMHIGHYQYVSPRDFEKEQLGYMEAYLCSREEIWLH